MDLRDRLQATAMASMLSVQSDVAGGPDDLGLTMLTEASEADDERKKSREADWMIPPIRRSRSAFGPRAKLCGSVSLQH
jgi:hypothetical protein